MTMKSNIIDRELSSNEVSHHNFSFQAKICLGEGGEMAKTSLLWHISLLDLAATICVYMMLLIRIYLALSLWRGQAKNSGVIMLDL